MKKNILILTLILLALFSIASACAGDVNDAVISNEEDSQIELTAIEDNIELNIDENNVINEEDNGTFAALQQKIDNAGDNSTIIFANNYNYDNGFTADGILINKSLTIDGKGYTINANHQSRIFNITAANVTLKNINFINGNASYGGAIIWNNADNGKITDCLFENNEAYDGGAIFWNRGTEGKIIESTFKNNNAIWRGGAIQIVNANNCEIKDCTFDNNTANRSAGAIYVNNCTYITIDNSIFENNQVNYSGGAIYFDGDNGIISNSNFTNNKARYNGAVCMNSVQGTVADCIFANNIATDSAGALGWAEKENETIVYSKFINNSAPHGGAIFLNNGANLFIYASIFENNTASEKGGAIFWDSGNEGRIMGSSFINNQANISGGAIFWDSGNEGRIMGSSFINNQANISGGAINCEKDNLTITDCNFIDNTASRHGGATFFNSTGTVKNCNFTENTATKGNGGAVWINSGSLENCYFTNNKASNRGGAIYIHDDSTITNCNFDENTASGRGGALYFYIGGNVENCNFTDNAASDGGAVFFYADSTVTNCNFVNNTASEWGGAIRMSSGSVENCNFTNNKANMNGGRGGAINCKGGTLTVSNSAFTNNTAENGGAIYTENSTNSIKKSSFKQNTAFSGGAIKIRNDTDAIIADCEFISNKAYSVGEGSGWNESAAGGAIYASINLNLKISNSQFIGNSIDSPNSFGLGGALYVYGNLTVDKSIFDENVATSENDLSIGSAIAAGGNHTQILINNTEIKNGESQRAALYIWRSNAVIDNTTFTNNKASENGGALHYYNGNEETNILTIINSAFTGNTANNGGALYVRNSDAKVINTSFTKNNAQSGGAICTEDGRLDIYDSEFVENNAYDGGAIYNDGETIINYSKFTDNNATEGQAIKTTNDMAISNSEFIGNGENCIDVESGAKITLDNVSSDAPLVNDTISMEILEAEDVVYGNDVNIKVQVNSSALYPLNSGKVVVKVNGVEYDADVNDGIATLVIPKLNAGTYTTNVAYIDNILKAEIPVKFTVNKKGIIINAKNAAYVINYGGTYKVTFTNVTDGTKVTFTLNGKNIGTSTIKNGAASIKLTAKILKTAKAGTKNLIIKVENSNYNPISKTVKITINKEKTKITAKAKTFKRTTKIKKYTIILKNSKNKAMKKAKVYLKVKGKTYAAKTNSKGKATFKITKLSKKGTYKAVIKYNGNSYYSKVIKNIKIKIK